MRAARHDALERALALPIESNQLFKTYVDLRSAKLTEIEPYLETGDAAKVSTVLPEGAAGLLEITEDRVVARALSHQAVTAGGGLGTTTKAFCQPPGPPPP